MKYIESCWTDPYYNLALEEYVFEKLDRSSDWLILWQNFNTIVIGKYQNTVEEINADYVREHGISVARRLSGGGAVYHDKGNLNYTIIVDKDENFDFNFRYFVQPLTQTLKQFGIEAEFSGRNDVMIDGKKFSGNSQYIKHNRIMHHGCIMLDSNLSSVADALKVKEIKTESKSTKSVRSRVTTINANAETPIPMETFKEALKKQIAAGNPVQEYSLTETDIAEIKKLRDEKYATWEWNYGFSPEYSVRKEAKFESGIVTVHMNVEKGRIREVRLFGDFFGNGEISELENELKGLPLDDKMGDNLKDVHAEKYINGITTHELIRLLRD